MNLKEKKSYRKLAKQYSIIAWVLIGICITTIITLLVFEGKLSKVLNAILIISILAEIIAGQIFIIISKTYSQRLNNYIRDIRKYRIRRNYCKALRLIESNDLKSAINIHNNLLPAGDKYNDLLYIALIHELKYSEDTVYKENAFKHIQMHIEENTEDKIIM